MNDEFIPQNALERDLIAAMNGEIAPDLFLQGLLKSQLFMPVKDAGHAERDDLATPLVLEDGEGGQALAMFTSPERAKGFLSAYPDFEGGLLVDIPWALGRMGGGYGVVINPGWETGLELDAETLGACRT